MGKLGESEELLRLFIEHAPTALAMFDRHMRYLAASGRWLTDYGLADRDVVGLSHYEVFPEIPERWKLAHRRGLAGEIVRADEDRFERADGSVQWLRWEIQPWHHSDGSMGGIVIFTEDVTKRVQAERALANAVQEQRELLDTAATGLTFCSRDLRYVSANTAYAALLGRTVEEIVGRSLDDMLGEDAVETIRPYVDRVLSGERVEFDVQMPVNGNARVMSAVYSPVGDVTGAIIGWVASVTDITERKRIEHERETTMRLLSLLNTPGDLRELMRDVTALMCDAFDCEAVGIRLRDGDDYPYFETRGFPELFVRMERRLCVYDPSGNIILDETGNPLLECMCGNILRGRFDAKLPFFTERGSFWTNSTTELLSSTTEADRQAHTRNRCHGEGFESVGLFPLRAAGVTYGLLQLNDHRLGRFTPESVALLERLADNLAVSLAHRRVLAERETLAQHRQLALDAAQLGWWRYDPATRICTWDDTYREIFGVSGGSRPNDEILAEVVHPDDRVELSKRIESALDLDHPQPFAAEYRINRPDGRMRWIEAHGIATFEGEGAERRAVELVSTVQDTTERKQAEEDLRASEAKHRRLFETSQDAIMVLDLETWQCEAGNPASVQIFGARDHEDFVSHAFQDYSPECQPDGRSSAEMARERIATALRDGTCGFDWTHRRLNGEEFPAKVLLTRFQFGDRSYVQATVRDVTHEIELEAQLRQAQKLESIGTLAGGVAHEINNPIMVVLGYAQLIEELVPEDSQIVELAREIERSTERVAAIVRNLLRFARQEQQHPAPAQLRALIDDTLSLIRSVIRHDQIVLEVDVPADLPDITCVGQQIQQVIMNLVTNAKDALNEKYEDSHDEKIVRITARMTDLSDGAPAIRLTVEDHGPGVPEAIRGRIFDPFFTTKSRDVGTGLGLSISYGIVKDHGGTMTVESEVGNWTRIHVDLPVGC